MIWPTSLPSPTLRALYLDPLKQRVSKMGGKVHRADRFLLLIDVKSEAEPTYAALENSAHKLFSMLTAFSIPESKPTRSGLFFRKSRHRMVSRQAKRWLAIDGRLPDLKKHPPVTLVPLVSDNGRRFSMKGDGPMPDSEKLQPPLNRHPRSSARRQIRLWPSRYAGELAHPKGGRRRFD